MDLDIYNSSYDQFVDLVAKPKARILDIGCGPGNITKYLLKKRPDFYVEGIDIAPNMVERLIIRKPVSPIVVR
jgi:trans-aconitate methyltransferase